jgi:transposase
MRKIALALIAILISACFALNASASVKGENVLFVIDGDHYTQSNLTIFVQKDGVQVRGLQKNNVGLPYYFPIPYNESGTYSMTATDEKGGFAEASVSVEVPDQTEAEQQQAENQGNTEIAIIFALVGLAAIVFISLRFIKSRSDSK